MSLETLNQLADASRPETHLSGLIAGQPSTGKTHLTLTAPRPCITFYCDRAEGDEDLVKAAKDGVFRIYIRRGNVVRDVRKYFERIASGDLSKEGIKTVCIDSLTYLQALVKADSIPLGKSVSQQKYGQIAGDLEVLLQSFFTLEQHRILFSHIKAERTSVEVDGQMMQKLVWMPDAMPFVRKLTQREVSLMGYTWRKKKEGEDDRFGVNFTESVASRGQIFEFQDAKAPAGWGNEEPDISKWIEKLYPPKGKEKTPDPVPEAAPAQASTPAPSAAAGRSGKEATRAQA